MYVHSNTHNGIAIYDWAYGDVNVFTQNDSNNMILVHRMQNVLYKELKLARNNTIEMVWTEVATT